MMLDLVFISMRETAEVLLLLLALATCLGRERADGGAGRSLGPCLAIGAVVGAVGGVAFSVALSASADAVLLPVLDLAFGLFLAWMAVGVLTSNRQLRQAMSMAIERGLERLGWPIVTGGLAAFVTFRESFELAFLVWRRIDGLAAADAALAIGTGIALVLVLPIAVRRLRLRLEVLFRLSALLLAYVAVGLIVDGLLGLGGHALQVVGSTRLQPTALAELRKPLVVCLMLLPVYRFLRDWWCETELTSDRRRSS